MSPSLAAESHCHPDAGTRHRRPHPSTSTHAGPARGRRGPPPPPQPAQTPRLPSATRRFAHAALHARRAASRIRHTGRGSTVAPASVTRTQAKTIAGGAHGETSADQGRHGPGGFGRHGRCGRARPHRSRSCHAIMRGLARHTRPRRPPSPPPGSTSGARDHIRGGAQSMQGPSTFGRRRLWISVLASARLFIAEMPP